jgi:FkbM family methyltransferase
MIGRLRAASDRFRLRRSLRPRSNVPLVRFGSRYGGWVIPSDLVDASSIVYSGGVGEDVTFDLALIERTGCSVWAFDPTPRSIEYASKVSDDRFHFHPVGLWSTNCVKRFYGPLNPRDVSHTAVASGDDRTYFDAECKSLETIMRELEHDHVDLLKLDIEGAEFDVIGSLTTTPECICVELHPVRALDDIVDFVRSLPYDVLHVEGWNVTLARA